MRIRNAALAGATAIAVAFGGTTVASAQETINQGDHTVEVEDAQSTTAGNDNADVEGSNMSSRIGDKFEKEKPAQGPAIFGSSKDLGSQPKWAQAFYGLTITAGVAALIGGIIGPVYNFIMHGPFSR